MRPTAAGAFPTRTKRRTIRSAPKSHTGCRTCKRRRIKCDEARPHCRRCAKHGVDCEGYTYLPPTQILTETKSIPSRSKKARLPKSCSGSVFHSYQKQSLRLSLCPTYGTQQEQQALAYYTSTLAVAVSQFSSPVFWRILVPQASWAEPTVKHALVALSMLQESLRVVRSDLVPIEARSMWHYNQTIKILSKRTPSVEVVLIVCFLFFTYENTLANFKVSRRHIKSGLNIIKEWLGGEGQVAHEKDITREIIPRFREGLAFLRACSTGHKLLPPSFATNIPSNADERGDTEEPVPEPASFASSTIDGSFATIDEAYAALHSCTRQLPSASSGSGAAFNPLLFRWKRTFQSSTDLQQHDNSLLRLLSVHYYTCRILGAAVHNESANLEMAFDAHLGDFSFLVQEMEILIMEMKARPMQQPQRWLGMLPPLVLTGLKCRVPSLRRKAYTLLKHLPDKEGRWTGLCAARIVQRCMELEEKGLETTKAKLKDVAARDIGRHRRLSKIRVEVVKSPRGQLQAWMSVRLLPAGDEKLLLPTRLALDAAEINKIDWPISDLLDAYGYQDLSG